MEHSKPKIKQLHVYFIQILFVSGITIGSQTIDFENRYKWLAIIARYVVYFIIIEGTRDIIMFVYDALYSKCYMDVTAALDKVDKNRVMMSLAATGVVFYNNMSVFTGDFPLLFIGHLIVKYPESTLKHSGQSGTTITYGTGMACSFFEGYLMQILPSDGHKFDGFEWNIMTFEAQQGVVFPVKKLFLVITKSLYCPPDLKHFNKINREDLPKLEAIQYTAPIPMWKCCYCAGLCCYASCVCGDVSNGTEQRSGHSCGGRLKSLEEVQKDVAGVKNRRYRNSAYKIYRPNRKPVCLALECASPLHTLSLVLKNRNLYEELSNINVDEVVEDFCSTLLRLLAKSPECKGKCELVYFDDTDPNQNLADVLLDKIRELEPNFENIVTN